MKENLKLILTILAIVGLAGCTQEQGEKLVEQSWGFFKYGWYVPLALGIIGFIRGNVLMGAGGIMTAIFGLIMWWVYYLMACPELCALI